MQAWSTDVVSKAGPLKASSANSVLIHHVPLFTRNVSKRLLQLLPDFCDVELNLCWSHQACFGGLRFVGSRQNYTYRHA